LPKYYGVYKKKNKWFFEIKYHKKTYRIGPFEKAFDADTARYDYKYQLNKNLRHPEINIGIRLLNRILKNIYTIITDENKYYGYIEYKNGKYQTIKSFDNQEKAKKEAIDGLRDLINENRAPMQIINDKMSNMIRNLLRNDKVRKPWSDYIGYTAKELKSHLESKFKKGMSWKNCGLWHIDHIKPRSLFNFSSPEDEEFKKCWALNNLQPLWALDNLHKSNKYIEKEMG